MKLLGLPGRRKIAVTAAPATDIHCPTERTFALQPGLAVAATVILPGLHVTGGLFLGGYLMLQNPQASGLPSPTWLLFAINAFALAVTLRLACGFGCSSWRNFHLLVPRRPAPLGAWIGAVPLLAGNAVLIMSLTAWLLAALPADLPTDTILESLLDFEAQPWAVSSLAVLLAPVGEEILFRAVILSGLLRTMRPWPAIILSTVLFAVAHANLVQLPVGLIMGLTLI